MLTSTVPIHHTNTLLRFRLWAWLDAQPARQRPGRVAVCFLERSLLLARAIVEDGNEHKPYADYCKVCGKARTARGLLLV